MKLVEQSVVVKDGADTVEKGIVEVLLLHLLDENRQVTLQYGANHIQILHTSGQQQEKVFKSSREYEVTFSFLDFSLVNRLSTPTEKSSRKYLL